MITLEMMPPLMFGGLILTMLIGFPVAFTLAALGLSFGFLSIYLGFFDLNFLQAIPGRIFGSVISNELLLAIPFFTFMGAILEKCGLAEDMLDSMGQLFGPVRGGLGYSVIIVGFILGAITGTVAGLQETLPGINPRLMTHLDGKGEFEKSLDVVRRYLRRTTAKRTLIAAVNDPSALGALRAFEEAGRGHLCAVIGQNATRVAREELRRPQTRLIGSVAYFPERYGDELIPLALAILQKKPVPASVFVKHQLITAKNVSLIYPAQTE